jgi:hypothetical protein
MRSDSFEENEGNSRSPPTETRPNADINPETPKPLLDLAEEISGVLVPVESNPGFRDGLGDQLSAVVRQRRERRVVELSEDSRWAFILGASLVSLVPLLGLVLYVLRSRLMSRAQHAVSH